MVKTKKTSSPPEEALFTARKVLLSEQLILRLPFNRAESIPKAKQTLKKQTDSVGHSHIYNLLQKVECFRAENIHNHLSQWKSITSDPFIIDIVKSGLKNGILLSNQHEAFAMTSQ